MKNVNVKQPKKKIGAGYIRESTEEQDKGFSPDNQKRTIEDYAKRNNIEITFWYKDLVTGTSANKRDDFQRMIDDAMQNKFEAIVFFHTSRFARNIEEAKHYKKMLRKKLNIDVLSATQHFGDNWEDPSSFLNESVNEVFDEYYSRQLSFWVRNSLMEKRRQGKQNGNPPLGYYKKKIGYDDIKKRPIYDPKWRVDKDEAKLVNKIFQMYATGNYSYVDIAQWLNKQGYQTKLNVPFTYSSLKCILANRVYLGKVWSWRKGYEPLPGEHPAILKDKLFNKVQEMIQDRRNTKGRPVAQHRFYLLQDLVYCYNCIKHLRGKEDNPNAPLSPKMYCETHMWEYPRTVKHETLYYCCKLRRENKSCNQPHAKAQIIDKQVMSYMEGFNLPNDIIQNTLDHLKKLFEQADNSVRDQTVVERLLAKKKKLNFQFRNTEEYTEEEYVRMLKSIDTELAKYDTLGLVDKNAKVKEAECIQKTESFLKDFTGFWNSEIGNTERREWIRMTIKRVWVKDQQVVAIEPQEDFKPLFSSYKKLIAQPPIAAPKERILPCVGFFLLNSD